MIVFITIVSIASQFWDIGKHSADPDQLLHNVTSDQGLHCFA